MHITIDQSGKVEQTSKTTVVAYANGVTKTVQISSIEKQKLAGVMRVMTDFRRIYVYMIFAALVFLVVESMQNISEITIDREYPGHEGIIKDVLTGLFKKFHRIIPEITFAEIGKKSAAHKAALEVYRKERKPDVVVKASDVLRVFSGN